MNERKSLVYHFAEAYERYRAERREAPVQDIQPRQSGRLGRLLRWLTPNGGTLLLVAMLILTTNVWAKPLLSPTSAPGPSATTVNYQGRLADSGGSPLSGTYGMTFALYGTATGGSPVWGPESHAAVPVSDGLFSVGLGSQMPGGIPTSVWDGDRYLEIMVGGETLSPRELIRSVPIAGMALTVPDGSITSEKLGFRLPQFLGHKTCNGCGQPSEVCPGSLWCPVKGANTQDIVETTVTTHGGPVIAYMTNRYNKDPAGASWCGIAVLQGGSWIRFAHLDGETTATSNYGCSGACTFTDLPAGTYTFRAVDWVDVPTTVQSMSLS